MKERRRSQDLRALAAGRKKKKKDEPTQTAKRENLQDLRDFAQQENQAMKPSGDKKKC